MFLYPLDLSSLSCGKAKTCANGRHGNPFWHYDKRGWKAEEHACLDWNQRIHNSASHYFWILSSYWWSILWHHQQLQRNFMQRSEPIRYKQQRNWDLVWNRLFKVVQNLPDNTLPDLLQNSNAKNNLQCLWRFITSGEHWGTSQLQNLIWIWRIWWEWIQFIDFTIVRMMIYQYSRCLISEWVNKILKA